VADRFGGKLLGENGLGLKSGENGGEKERRETKGGRKWIL
jgi:hypothetical protein